MFKIHRKTKELIKNEQGIEIVQKIGLIAVGMILLGAFAVNISKTAPSHLGMIENSATTIYDEVGPDNESGGNTSGVMDKLKIVAFNTQQLGGFDASYYALAEEGICEATHSKSGTAHTLTSRAETFSFKASGAWKTGDTVTFNGKSATFYDLNGNNISNTDNLFVSGAVIKNALAKQDTATGTYKIYITVFPK